MTAKRDAECSTRYLSGMRAHYKRSKRRIGADWLRLYLSPVFERGRCTEPPPGMSEVVWAQKWTAPTTTEEVREAMRICRDECSALEDCRVLVMLAGEKPVGVVQAGQAYRLRVGGPRKKQQTPTKEDVA